MTSFLQHQQTLETSKNNTQLNQLDTLNKIFHNKKPIQICQSMISYLSHLMNNLKQNKDQISLNQCQERIQTKKSNLLNQNKLKKQQQIIQFPSRKTRWIRNTTIQEQKIKYQQQKYIAFAFCQHGINYHAVLQKYPNMLPKTYRCYVEAVNNQAVNQIVDFLRYQCNIQVQKLNRDQKRSIRTQLTKIRQWLGNRDKDQLQTFYLFIYRHYDKSIQIKFEAALKLYKTIIQIIRSPYVNVLQAQEKDQEQNLSKQQEKAMIILYIKHKDQNKVADGLCQKYGYDIKWSLLSVKMTLKTLLEAALDKMINSFQATQKELYKNYFVEQRRKILRQCNDPQIRVKLYGYYLQKKPSYPKVVQILQKIREYLDIFSLQDTTSLPKIQQSTLSHLPLDYTNMTEQKRQLFLDESYIATSKIKIEQHTS